MQNQGEGTLYVIGVGVQIPGHTTIAALEALSRCDRIYTLVQQPPDMWLPAGRTAVTEIVNLMGLYSEGALRSDNYSRVANTILQGLNQVGCVGYVTYGNPMSYDSVAQTLAREAVNAPWRLEIIAGVSSIDTILCDLRIDMAPGIQVYEASWLEATRTPLNASAAVILTQLGHFGTMRAHYRQPRRGELLAGLVAYLSAFYPESHTVMLVQSSSDTRPASVARVELRDLCRIEDKDWAESMYIPPVQPAQLTADAIARLSAES